MIKIDNVSYNADWVANSLTQTADILNGDESGRLQGDKDMYLEYVGTFFNHSGQIHRSRNCSDAEWDLLFNALANPINDHIVEFPYGQGKLVQKIYISSINRKLVHIDENGTNWGRTYDVTFTAMYSKWKAGRGLEADV